MDSQIIKAQMSSLIGRRIQLIDCTDEFTPMAPGSQGTISHIDNTGTVFVDWDNGSALGLIPGIDKWKYIK